MEVCSAGINLAPQQGKQGKRDSEDGEGSKPLWLHLNNRTDGKSKTRQHKIEQEQLWAATWSESHAFLTMLTRAHLKLFRQQAGGGCGAAHSGWWPVSRSGRKGLAVRRMTGNAVCTSYAYATAQNLPCCCWAVSFVSKRPLQDKGEEAQEIKFTHLGELRHTDKPGKGYRGSEVPRERKLTMYKTELQWA